MFVCFSLEKPVAWKTNVVYEEIRNEAIVFVLRVCALRTKRNTRTLITSQRRTNNNNKQVNCSIVSLNIDARTRRTTYIYIFKNPTWKQLFGYLRKAFY